MPHWLAVTLAVLGALASWRWVIRPLRSAWRRFMAILEQIRASSSGVANLTREVQGLAGAVVQLVIAVLDNQEQLRTEHAELREHYDDLRDLVIDLDADVRRLEKRVFPKEESNEPD